MKVSAPQLNGTLRMLLSHSDMTFRFRRQLLAWTVGGLAISSILVPSPDWLQRSIAPLKVILSGAMAYCVVLVLLHIIAMIWIGFAKFYALFCYYGGIFGLVLIPLFLAIYSNAAGYPFASAAYFADIIPQMAAGVCGAAAGFNWLQSAYATYKRWSARVLANTSIRIRLPSAPLAARISARN